MKTKDSLSFPSINARSSMAELILNKESAVKKFVGRGDEVEKIVSAIKAIGDDDGKASSVIQLYGGPGMGKTELLEKVCEQLDLEDGSKTCFNTTYGNMVQIPSLPWFYYDFRYGDLDIVSMVLSMAEGLSRKCDFSFPLVAYAASRINMFRNQDNSIARKRNVGDMVGKLGNLGLSIAGNLPLVGPFLGVLKDNMESLEIGLKKSIMLFHHKEIKFSGTRLDRGEVVRRIEETDHRQLTKSIHILFSVDLNANIEKMKGTGPFVFMLDTYEHFSQKTNGKDDWLNGAAGLINSSRNVLWLIAGRNKLPDDQGVWGDVKNVYASMLKELSVDDTCKFFQSVGMEDADFCKSLAGEIDRTPINLDICHFMYLRLPDDSRYDIKLYVDQSPDELFGRYTELMNGDREMVHMVVILSLLEEGWDNDMISIIRQQFRYDFSVTTYSRFLLDFPYFVEHDSIVNRYKIIESARSVFCGKASDIERQRVKASLAQYHVALIEGGRTGADVFEKCAATIVDAGIVTFDIFHEVFEPHILAMVKTGQNELASRLLSTLKKGCAKDDLRLNVILDSLACINDLENDGLVGSRGHEGLSVVGDVLEKLSGHPRYYYNYAKGLEALSQGEYLAAYGYLSKALRLANALFGEYDSMSIEIRTRLSLVLYDLGRYAEALSYGNEAFDTLSLLYGKSALDTQNAMLAVADINSELCDFDKAENLYVQCISVQEETYGEDHIVVLRAKSRYAAHLRRMKDYEKAEEVDAGIIKTVEANPSRGNAASSRLLKVSIPGTGAGGDTVEVEEERPLSDFECIAWTGLGFDLLGQDRTGEAGGCFSKVCIDSGRQDPHSFVRSVMAMSGMVRCAIQENNVTSLQSLANRLDEGLQILPMPATIERLVASWAKASCLLFFGQYDESCSICEQALADGMRVFGPENSIIQDIRIVDARAHAKNGDGGRAIALYCEYLQYWNRHGQEDKLELAILELVDLYEGMGRYSDAINICQDKISQCSSKSILLSMAECALKDGNCKAEIEALTRLYEVDGSTEYGNRLFKALVRDERYDDAADFCLPIIDESKYENYIQLIDASEKISQWDRAVALYKKMLDNEWGQYRRQLIDRKIRSSISKYSGAVIKDSFYVGQLKLLILQYDETLDQRYATNLVHGVVDCADEVRRLGRLKPSSELLLLLIPFVEASDAFGYWQSTLSSVLEDCLKFNDWGQVKTIRDQLPEDVLIKLKNGSHSFAIMKMLLVSSILDTPDDTFHFKDLPHGEWNQRDMAVFLAVFFDSIGAEEASLALMRECFSDDGVDWPDSYVSEKLVQICRRLICWYVENGEIADCFRFCMRNWMHDSFPVDAVPVERFIKHMHSHCEINDFHSFIVFLERQGKGESAIKDVCKEFLANAVPSDNVQIGLCAIFTQYACLENGVDKKGALDMLNGLARQIVECYWQQKKDEILEWADKAALESGGFEIGMASFRDYEQDTVRQAKVVKFVERIVVRNNQMMVGFLEDLLHICGEIDDDLYLRRLSFSITVRNKSLVSEDGISALSNLIMSFEEGPLQTYYLEKAQTCVVKSLESGLSCCVGFDEDLGWIRTKLAMKHVCKNQVTQCRNVCSDLRMISKLITWLENTGGDFYALAQMAMNDEGNAFYHFVRSKSLEPLLKRVYHSGWQIADYLLVSLCGVHPSEPGYERVYTEDDNLDIIKCILNADWTDIIQLLNHILNIRRQKHGDAHPYALAISERLLECDISKSGLFVMADKINTYNRTVQSLSALDIMQEESRNIVGGLRELHFDICLGFNQTCLDSKPIGLRACVPYKQFLDTLEKSWSVGRDIFARQEWMRSLVLDFASWFVGDCSFGASDIIRLLAWRKLQNQADDNLQNSFNPHPVMIPTLSEAFLEVLGDSVFSAGLIYTLAMRDAGSSARFIRLEHMATWFESVNEQKAAEQCTEMALCMLEGPEGMQLIGKLHSCGLLPSGSELMEKPSVGLIKLVDCASAAIDIPPSSNGYVNMKLVDVMAACREFPSLSKRGLIEEYFRRYEYGMNPLTALIHHAWYLQKGEESDAFRDLMENNSILLISDLHDKLDEPLQSYLVEAVQAYNRTKDDYLHGSYNSNHSEHAKLGGFDDVYSSIDRHDMDGCGVRVDSYYSDFAENTDNSNDHLDVEGFEDADAWADVFDDVDCASNYLWDPELYDDDDYYE